MYEKTVTIPTAYLSKQSISIGPLTTSATARDANSHR